MVWQPTSAEVFPQIFDDAVYAWNTGQFEGQGVFQVEDPGGAVPEKDDKARVVEAEPADAPPTETEAEPSNANDVAGAGIRIDLSRIGGQK